MTSIARASPTPHAATRNAALTGCARWRCVYAGSSTSFSRAARSASSRHERRELADERDPLVAYVQPEVERDLIVARSRRVKARRDGADALAELRLDGHVDVLLVGGELQRARARLVVERRAARRAGRARPPPR